MDLEELTMTPYTITTPSGKKIRVTRRLCSLPKQSQFQKVMSELSEKVVVARREVDKMMDVWEESDEIRTGLYHHDDTSIYGRDTCGVKHIPTWLYQWRPPHHRGVSHEGGFTSCILYWGSG